MAICHLRWPNYQTRRIASFLNNVVDHISLSQYASDRNEQAHTCYSTANDDMCVTTFRNYALFPMITQQVVDLVVVDLRATMQHVHLVLAQNHETASDFGF